LSDAGPLTLRAPAKVNLALSVGPPDARGMHPIASWMVAVEWGDDLTLRRAEAGGLTLDRRWADDAPHTPAIDWAVEADLAWRAHAALEAEAGRPLPVAAELVKRVPPGAGLGGGSGDAAAMLVGLRRLYGLPLSDADLKRVAGTLGSDIPFAVDAVLGRASAVVTGLGERIEPSPLAGPVHLVLVLPPLRCPTGAVYRAFDRSAEHAAVDEPRVRALAAMRPAVPAPSASPPAHVTPADSAAPESAPPESAPPDTAPAGSGLPDSRSPQPPPLTDPGGTRGPADEIDFSHNDMCQKVDLWAAGLFNDLAEPAARVAAGLREARDRVAGVAGRAVHVTGSGAAMFVVARDGTEASAVVARVVGEAGVPAVATRTVGDGR